MQRLVEELLDVTRLSAGPLTLRREQVDLAGLVTEVLDALGEDLRRAGCNARLEAASPVVGYWDRLRLEQVVENLVRNALIYGAGKPIELRARLAETGEAELTVRDFGIGLDEALQARAFRRFERGVSAQHYGGLGLGLYIAKQVVDAHHGSIGVASTPGEGATFSIRLPTALALPERERDSSSVRADSP
ncbi:MAG: HAMP domain-containing sensor histidine kinase [Polyangiales bacterium]